MFDPTFIKISIAYRWITEEARRFSPQNFIFYHLVPTFLPKKVYFIVFTQFFGHFAQNVPTLVDP